MAVKSKTQLKADNDTLITTNGSGDITGAILNGFEEDIIDSFEDFIQSFTYANMIAIATPATYQKVMVTDFTPTPQLFIYTGTYWKPICGCVVLNVNATQTGTDANTSEKTLATFTLPANYLNQNLDYIEIEAWGSFAANNNNKTVKLVFGTYNASVTWSTGTGNDGTWSISSKIIRTGSATQKGVSNFDANKNASLSNPSGTKIRLSATEDCTSSIAISITGTNGTANANDIVFEGMTITLHRK